jgi:hypothetical protein
MAEKTVRSQQRSLGFSIADPVVSRRIDIQIEFERVAAEPNTCDWIIRWRTSETSAEFVERLCRLLVELCRAQRVWTDNGLSFHSRRKGAGGDGR